MEAKVRLKKKFALKFGDELVASLPTGSGVYRFLDSDDQVIYVGKAKNLRRRLGQYQNSKRRKKHAKMRQIVAVAARFEFESCETEIHALLRENELIQALRPRFNLSGAFSFLYPSIGIKSDLTGTLFCYSTSPDLYPEFTWYGSFRSRDWTQSAFDALIELLEFIGHRMPYRMLPKRQDRFSKFVGYRNLPKEWVQWLGNFLEGSSPAALESLVLALIENAGARRRGRAIQKLLNELKRFWRFEALPLARAKISEGLGHQYIAQGDRDALMIRARASVSFNARRS